MEPGELMWVAGLLEGEGSFVTKSGTYRPVVQCSMTDEDVIEVLRLICGGKVYRIPPAKDHYKMIWHWRIEGEKAEELMAALRPRMGQRRKEQIDQALSNWLMGRAEFAARIQSRQELAEEAAQFYLDMPVKSLRTAAKKFGVSHVTIATYVKKLSPVTQ